LSTTPGPVPLPPASTAKTNRAVAAFRRLKKQFGLYSGGEILPHLRSRPFTGHIVENLIAPCSVNLLVGDSGIGKSPFAYQMGLTAATGAPFLGLPTKFSKVLYLDYENQFADVDSILTQQCRHLGLNAIPARFLLWTLAADPEQEIVEQVIDNFAADLVIIDCLRTFNPLMETESSKAVEQIKRLRAIASQNGTAFLLVHHLRKHANAIGSLEDGRPLDWLRGAAGVRAIVNQTDSRLALARRGREKESDDLVLSGHLRVRGEAGPYLVRRQRDAHGEPAGYERFEPVPALIENAEQEAAFYRLADAFTFGDAERTLGRSPAATNWFVQKLIRLGLVHKVGRGQYRKHAPVQELAA